MRPVSISLYNLHSSKCSLSDNVTTIIKYADNTVIIGLLDDEQRSLDMYLSEIDSFVPTVINNSEVELVKTYKYLGTVIDKLKGSYNVNCIYKKLNLENVFCQETKES